MVVFVMRPAQPANLQRLSVVVVVHLGGSAAVFARLAREVAAFKVNVCVGSRVGAEALKRGKVAVFRSVGAHVGGVARSAL